MPRSTEAARWLERLRSNLAGQGTARRAQQEKRYLKSELELLGVTVPSIRREARAFVKNQPELDRRHLRALAEAAWATPVHELRAVVIAILERRREVLTAADATWLIQLVAASDTWAHVDWLAIEVIGALTARYGALDAALDRWARHESFWVRRAALLSFHDALRAGVGDFDHFARLAAPMLGEREFFIRKAIGWVLRSASLARPALVVAFVAEHAAELSGLTFREATRRLPAAAQGKLTARRAAAQRRGAAQRATAPIRAGKRTRRAAA
jgi:3-methyladenine DNA glycosylase AlkD